MRVNINSFTSKRKVWFSLPDVNITWNCCRALYDDMYAVAPKSVNTCGNEGMNLFTPSSKCCCHWGELHETRTSLNDVINIQGIKVLFILSHNQHKDEEQAGVRYLRVSERLLSTPVLCDYGRKTCILYTRYPVSHFIYLCRFRLRQCFSTFVRPRPSKFFFHKTRAQSQQIYS